MNPSDQARQIGVVTAWLAQYRVSNSQTNPPNDTVLCDTNQMAAGYYDVFFGALTNCAVTMANISLQWRNAANAADLFSVGFCAANQLSYWGQLLGIQVVVNERFRLYITTGFTGTVVGFILAVRRA